jgi:SAM-dependent methyltransferase
VKPSPGDLAGVSEDLLVFVGEMPWERRSIAEFVAAAAQSVPPGARVLDVGAGDAPYRELFAHTRYETTDWTESPHAGAGAVDYVASADALPLDEGSVDVVLLTQVLEHVPEPAQVLAELARVLKPGGRLYLTAPLVWELHELPHDYFRYTGPGLRHLLAGSGFVDVVVEPRNDCFTTLAQLLTNAAALMGTAPDGLDDRRAAAAETLREFAGEIAQLAPLDARRVLPLGYQASATRAP